MPAVQTTRQGMRQPAQAACCTLRSSSLEFRFPAVCPTRHLYVCLLCCPACTTHTAGHRLHTLFKNSGAGEVPQGAGGAARAAKPQHKEQASVRDRCQLCHVLSADVQQQQQELLQHALPSTSTSCGKLCYVLHSLPVAVGVGSCCWQPRRRSRAACQPV